MMRGMLGVVLVVVTLGGLSAAQADYEAGQRMWDAGRHSEALSEWRAAANSGDAKAMLALGRLYVQGLGVPQNYVHAHMWFSLAASQFEAEAMKERDALAERMSPEQVAEAQKQAAAWQPGETQPAASATRKPAGPPPPKAIREAQELLTALGYEPDPPDGQWGARTAQAYQAFARDANLPMTDTLTPAALKAMRARARQVGAVSTPEPEAALPPDALHRAAKAGNLKGLKAALAAGMDLNARDDKGWTALMYVVDKGYVLLVEPLVQAKADPDVRAPDGATALFMAAAHGHGEIIPLLMKAGADPMIKGPKGKTATELAQARKEELDQYNLIIEALLAGKKADDYVFERLKSIGRTAYGRYLEDFPHGRHADEAREGEAFTRAESQGTAEALAEYIASYPSGRYVQRARRQLTERERPPLLLRAASPAGTTGRECDECPEMVVVPSGRFQMGDLPLSDYEPPTAPRRDDSTTPLDFVKKLQDYVKARQDAPDTDEIPVHHVTITAPFAVGKYEVTYKEWDACVAAGMCEEQEFSRGSHNPVEVSWEEAQKYLRWLSREVGKPYRLLSEAEWEYVARAGTTTKYWWGDEAHHDHANYGEDSEDSECCAVAGKDRWRTSAPVGSFKGNAFGLFDTAGNEQEWVEDCWNGSYRGAPSDGSAWTSGDCDKRVQRGGSWSDDPRNLRSAYRFRFDTGIRFGGFRVARTLD